MQQAFAISGFVNFLVSLSISLFVFIKKRNKANVLFSLLTLFTALWSFGYWVWLSQYTNYDLAIFWLKILTIGSIWIPIFFTNWISVLFDKSIIKRFNRVVLSVAYTLGILFTIIDLSSDLMVKSVSHKLDFIFWPTAGIFYIYYIIFVYFALSLYTAILLIKSYRKSSSSVRNQIKYVGLGCFIALMGGFFNFFLWYNISIAPYGNFIIPIYPILIAYAIIKFRLMDIRLIITRSILYGFLVILVAAFFSLSIFLAGTYLSSGSVTSKFFVYIISSSIVVIFLDPVKRLFARLTDRIFYKDRIDYQNILQQASAVVAKEIDLEKLSHSLSDLIANQLKIKEVLVLIARDDNFDLISGSKSYRKEFSLSAEFIDLIRDRKSFLIIDELMHAQSDISSDTLYYKQLEKFIKEAEALKIEMVVPIFDDNNNLSSIFLFSSKSSGDLYNQDDINFLKILVPQIATAIAKSKLYEEVQAFNRELQAKVEARTKSLKEANLGLEERNKFLTTLQVVITMISRTLDLKQVNQMIANSIALELGYIGGILSFIDEDSHVLRIGALTENEQTKAVIKVLGQDPRAFEAQLKADYSLGAQTVLSGKINFSDKMSDFFSPPVEKSVIDKIQIALGVKTIVGLPIFSENKIIGIIHFLLAIERRHVSALDIEMMTALTNQVGIVSRNLRLYNNLQSTNLELQEANMRLRELDKAKSEFLSIASHQLRTPISALKGYLSMMLDGDFGPIPDKIKQVIKDLFESASRLARLINVFLNVSRIESGRLKLEKHPLQVNDLITSVIKELGNQAEQKKIKLIYDEPKKPLPLVSADSDKLREVILNLIDNSIKYTLEGSITASAYVDQKDFHFVIKDTGIGIDPEEAKTLFRKFVRGTGVAQIHTGGSGLGLFIAQKIVKEHGGQVWAESEGKGKGSTFQFVIPINGGDSTPEALPAPVEN